VYEFSLPAAHGKRMSSCSENKRIAKSAKDAKKKLCALGVLRGSIFMVIGA
jgi:hypothetical protein